MGGAELASGAQRLRFRLSQRVGRRVQPSLLKGGGGRKQQAFRLYHLVVCGDRSNGSDRCVGSEDQGDGGDSP